MPLTASERAGRSRSIYAARRRIYSVATQTPDVSPTSTDAIKTDAPDNPRRKTRPSRSSVRKRLDSKKKQSSVKTNRGKVADY